ncbi:MAG TPA: class I adenylate-forming enzyme family protein, partial [Candidatus Dormibacteraeota bacterium]
MLTLAALPWAAAHRDPEAALLRLEDATLTASALDRAAAGIAAWLERQGVGAGHRVAVLCGNGLAFPPLYYGALRRGCVVAPLSTSSPPAEVARVLRAVRARVLACDPENAGAGTAALELAGTGTRRLVVSESTAGAPPGADLLDLASL